MLLHIFAACQRWCNVSKWSRAMGRATAIPESWQGQRVEQLPVRAADATERRVALAIVAATRRTPWELSCLAQAATGQLLLRRRRASGVVVIGLRAGPEGWETHAWLLGRRGALTGGAAATGFTATSVFETASGLRASDVELGQC